MESQYSIAEAKSKLPAIIHSIEKGGTATLTRHGRAVAVLLSVHEYERLHRSGEGFWENLESFRRHFEADDVVIEEADFEGLRDLSPGREVLWR